MTSPPSPAAGGSGVPPADVPATPAHAFAATRDWPGYFAAVAGRPPRETLLRALELFGSSPPGFAIDLGAGEGRDTAPLLARGWRVLAIDGHPEAVRRIAARADIPPAARARLEVRRAMLESADLPPCDFLNASFTLPFCRPEHFPALWSRIVAAIRPGGRFAGQFFGPRDDWAALPDRTHHSLAQVRALLSAFSIEFFQEEDKDGQDSLSHPKHWHAFHVVARAPLAPTT